MKAKKTVELGSSMAVKLVAMLGCILVLTLDMRMFEQLEKKMAELLGCKMVLMMDLKMAGLLGEMMAV